MASTTTARPSRVRLLLGFLAIYLIWGSTYLAIRFAIESMPPFLMAGVRWIIPGLALVAWARWREKAVPPTSRQLLSTAIIGNFLLVGGNGIVSWAEQWVPSGLTALLIASVPLWMATLEWGRSRVLGREHPLSPWRAAGLVLGFAGVGILVGAAFPGGAPSPDQATAAVDTRLLIGSIALLGASFLWAVGSLVARSAPLPSSPVLTVGLEMLWGGASLLLLGSLSGEWGRLDLAAVTSRSIGALVYLIAFGSVLGFSAYVWLLRVVSPAKVATYAYVNPVVAVLLGWLLGGEPLSARTLVAAGVVVGSVMLITTARN